MKFTNKIILISIITILVSKGAICQEQLQTNTLNNTVIPVEDINTFAKVYAITKNYYVESVSDTKLMNGAINGMLNNLDPHSTFLDAKEFKSLSERTSGKFAGLGIEVNKDKDDAIKVIAPIDGTPAYYAGVKSGDLIIKINNDPVMNMTLDEAISKMRGKVGSRVVITVYRKNILKPINFNITRAYIEVKSVKYTYFDNNYAYIRLTNFQSDTTEDLVNCLNNIYMKIPNIKGLVIDLRDNPGGLLQSAVGVLGSFLRPNSLVVYTKGRVVNTNQKFFINTNEYPILKKVPDLFKTIPIVLIVNQGSASASEIVAGAMQDYKRAKIVGTKTFGKGSVQSIIPLSNDTGVKLTTALYYTPNGRSIQANGIDPDIIIKSEYDSVLEMLNFKESSLQNHLDNPNGKHTISKSSVMVISPPKQISSEKELQERLDKQLKRVPPVVNQHTANIDLKNDFQLKWALNILQNKSLPKNEK